MKKLLCMILALGILLGLAGCGKTLEADASAYVVYDPENLEFSFDRAAFQKDLGPELGRKAEKLPAFLDSVTLEVSEDLTHVTVRYDAALAEAAGLVIGNTELSYRTESSESLVPEFTQDPGVL